MEFRLHTILTLLSSYSLSEAKKKLRQERYRGSNYPLRAP